MCSNECITFQATAINARSFSTEELFEETLARSSREHSGRSCSSVAPLETKQNGGTMMHQKMHEGGRENPPFCDTMDC